MQKRYFCISCGQEICHLSKGRCYSCYRKTIITRNYCCKDCGGLISRPTALKGNGRCRSCSRTGQLSWNKTTALSYKGKNHWNWQGGWKNKLPLCISCGKSLTYKKCKRCVVCDRKHRYNTNKRLRDQLLVAPKFKQYSVNNFFVRSAWEVLFCYWCDLSNIKYLYEPKRFKVGNNTYIPDFYLPEFDCYIEIKGYWINKKSKNKYKKFLKLYPTINIHLFRGKDLMTYLGITKHELSTYYLKLNKGQRDD